MRFKAGTDFEAGVGDARRIGVPYDPSPERLARLADPRRLRKTEDIVSVTPYHERCPHGEVNGLTSAGFFARCITCASEDQPAAPDRRDDALRRAREENKRLRSRLAASDAANDSLGARLSRLLKQPKPPKEVR